jgi:hypothetical protein
VIFTLSTPGCGALVAVLAALLGRTCSIGPPLLLAPIEPLPRPSILFVTTLSFQSSMTLSAAKSKTLAAGDLS